MLHGPLGWKLFYFAVPVAVTGILQQLFNAADVAVVGQFASKEAMAAVGSNSPIVGLLVNLFVGISLGANVVISMAIGSGDRERISKAVHTAVVFAVLAGLAMTALGEAISRPMLELLGVPENIMPMALAYLRIYIAGLPVIFLYNFESAIFRSHGDTRTPLICLIISGALNVVLNLFFVIVVGMDADGVALATVISNLISSLLMFIMLLTAKSDFRVEFSKLRIDGSALAQMLRIGVPAGVQGMVFAISNLCIQSAINSLGSDIMAASSAAFNIEILAYFIINGFGQACTTFTGQNSGARLPERCRTVFKITMLQSLAASVIMPVVLLLPGRFLLGLFNPDPVIADEGMVRMKMVLAFEFINAAMEILSGALRGHGYSLAPALLTLVGVCGLRIFWVFTIFKAHRSFGLLMASYPISWAITAAAIAVYYIVMRKKLYADPAGEAA